MQRRKTPSHEEILKYTPLVCNIALYFYRINKSKNIEFDDLLQTAWLGFMKGVKRYDSTKKTTLGTACRAWVFGSVYRSILGSRAIKQQRLQIGIDERHVPSNSDFTLDFEKLDYVNSLSEPDRSVIISLLNGNNIREICKLNKLKQSEVLRIINEYVIYINDEQA